MKTFRTIAVCISLLLCVSGTVAQQKFPLYTIRGEEANIKSENPAILILYDDGFCSACTKSLLFYISEICKESDAIPMVLISTAEKDIISLRSATSSVQSYFPDNTVFPFVYDLNPKEKKRLRNVYKVKFFPCVLLVPANGGKNKYISYRELFSGEEDISTNALQKIADFAGLNVPSNGNSR